MPLVSVIVVTWNAEDLLKACLDSLARQVFKDFETIVIDNASEDNTALMVEKNFPNVKLIKLKRNIGFAGGNVEGLKYAKGDFIALLNNDAEASPQWLGSLLNPMFEDDKIGICTSKVLVKGTNLLDSAGGGLTTAFTGFKIGMGRSADQYDKRRYVSGGYACACLYRKRMLDQIGFFDEDFIFNHEDTDLDLRAFFTGWWSVYVPDAVVEHHVSATLGKASAKSVYYFSRNSEFIWIKNVPLRLMIKFFHHRVLYECTSFAYFGIISGQWFAFLKGKAAVLAFLPKMIRKRKSIQAGRDNSLVYNRTRFLVSFVDYFRERLATKAYV